MATLNLPQPVDAGTIPTEFGPVAVSIFPDKRKPHEDRIAAYVAGELRDLGISESETELLTPLVASRLPARLVGDGKSIEVGSVDDTIDAMLDDESTRALFHEKTKAADRRRVISASVSSPEPRAVDPTYRLAEARTREQAARASSGRPRARVSGDYPTDLPPHARLAAARTVDNSTPKPRRAPARRASLDAPYPGTTDPTYKLANARSTA